VASWYGPGFHGKKTASGELYNMDAMTCAHKSLPFGTKLRLRNVENGKTAVVTVNDRGPFVRGRDIDLSRAAAGKLGIIGPGTGRVKVEKVGRDMRYIKYVEGGKMTRDYRPYDGPYTVQVGAFTDRIKAIRVQDGLRVRHRKAYIVRTEINGKELYRVRVGKFGDEEGARLYAERLSEEGYSTSVVPFEGRL